MISKDNNLTKSRTKSPTPASSSFYSTSSSSSTSDSRLPFSSSSGNTLFTSERSNMDYFTHAGVCKRTGATEDELAVFAMKENIENGLDFSEVNLPISYSGNPEIFVDIKYEKETNHIVTKIRNTNFGLKDIGFTEERVHAIFDDLDKFNSSKRNLFKLSRGLQGDALKEEVGIPYILGSKYSSEGEWNEPLIIRNGAGEEFRIRAVVDKVKRRNYCTVEKKAAAADNFTEIETRLPYNQGIINLGQIKQVLIKYAHITFHFNMVTSVSDNNYWNVTSRPPRRCISVVPTANDSQAYTGTTSQLSRI